MNVRWRSFYLIIYIFSFFVEINYAAEKPEFPDYKLYKAQRINQVFSLSNPPKVGAVLYAASAGGYALYLAEKMSPGGTLYVVDPWPNEKDYLKFLKNVALLNKQLVVHPIRMDVCDAGNALSATGAHVDFVFWDGEGSEERIKEQLESWWPLLAPDGVMVGDDYYSESIVGAVNRFNASISGTLETPAIWPTAPFKLWRISKGDRLEASSVGKRALDHFLTQYTPFTFGCGIMKGVGKDLGFPHQARIEEFNLLRSAFLNRFRAASEDQPPSTEIPRVHHSIWLTNIANPKDLYCQKRANGEKLWKYYEISLRKFEKKNGWTHVLWCLFPEQMPEMVELANEWGVEVRSIYDPQWGLYQKMPARHIFDAYLVDNHFSLAGNVLREAILYVYGGLYRDIAVELNFDPALMFSLCGAETFYASRTQRAGEQFDYLDQDICASAPGGRIPGKFLENIDTLYKGKAPAAGEENSVSAVFRRHFVDNCRAHIELVRPSQIMLAATQVCAEVGVAETGLVWGNDVSDMGIDGGKKLFTRHGNSSWRHRLWGCEKADESKVNLFNVVPFPYYEKISLAHHNSIRQAVVSTELQKIWQEQGAEKAEAGTEKPLDPKEKTYRARGKTYKNTMRRLLTLDAVLEAEDGRCAVEGNDLIFHKIWLTDQGSPTEVPDDLMAHFRASMALQDETAVCYFWCQDPTKIPATVAAFADFPRPVQVKLIDDEMADFGARWLYEYYLSRKIWALSGDILRHFVVNKYGGLYTDIGMELHVDMTKYIRGFDIILANRENWIDMCMIGVQKGHPYHGRFLDFLTNIRTETPVSLRYASLKRALHIHNSHGLGAWADNMDTDQTHLLLLPNQSFFTKHGLRSWWDPAPGKGLRQGVDKYTGPSFFTAT